MQKRVRGEIEVGGGVCDPERESQNVRCGWRGEVRKRNQKEEGMMKTMKKMVSLGLVVGLLAMMRTAVWAFNPSDFFTITLTPAGDRGVIITTTTIALGTLTVGTTEFTGGVEGVVVTSTGSIAPIEYTIEASLTGGWSLSTDGFADAADELAVHALFNSAAPAITDFESGGVTQNLLTTSAAQVGDVAGKFEGDQDLDDLALNADRNLWVQLKLPETTTTGSLQTVTVTVTGEAAD